MMSSREKKPYPELSRTNNFQRMLDIERKGRMNRMQASTRPPPVTRSSTSLVPTASSNPEQISLLQNTSRAMSTPSLSLSVPPPRPRTKYVIKDGDAVPEEEVGNDAVSETSSICHSPGWDDLMGSKRKKEKKEAKGRKKEKERAEAKSLAKAKVEAKHAEKLQSRLSKAVASPTNKRLSKIGIAMNRSMSAPLVPKALEPVKQLKEKTEDSSSRARKGSVEAGLKGFIEATQAVPVPWRSSHGTPTEETFNKKSPVHESSCLRPTSRSGGFIGGLKLKLADEAATQERIRRRQPAAKEEKANAVPQGGNLPTLDLGKLDTHVNPADGEEEIEPLHVIVYGETTRTYQQWESIYEQAARTMRSPEPSQMPAEDSPITGHNVKKSCNKIYPPTSSHFPIDFVGSTSRRNSSVVTNARTISRPRTSEDKDGQARRASSAFSQERPSLNTRDTSVERPSAERGRGGIRGYVDRQRKQSQNRAVSGFEDEYRVSEATGDHAELSSRGRRMSWTRTRYFARNLSTEASPTIKSTRKLNKDTTATKEKPETPGADGYAPPALQFGEGVPVSPVEGRLLHRPASTKNTIPGLEGFGLSARAAFARNSSAAAPQSGIVAGHVKIQAANVSQPRLKRCPSNIALGTNDKPLNKAERFFGLPIPATFFENPLDMPPNSWSQVSRNSTSDSSQHMKGSEVVERAQGVSTIAVKKTGVHSHSRPTTDSSEGYSTFDESSNVTTPGASKPNSQKDFFPRLQDGFLAERLGKSKPQSQAAMNDGIPLKASEDHSRPLKSNNSPSYFLPREPGLPNSSDPVQFTGSDPRNLERKPSLSRPTSTPELQQDLSFLPALKHQALTKPPKDKDDRIGQGNRPSPSQARGPEDRQPTSLVKPEPLSSTLLVKSEGSSLLSPVSSQYLQNAFLSLPQAPQRCSILSPAPYGPEPIAKMFVVCCSCKYFHDMPSKIYECMARSESMVEDKDLGVRGMVTTSVRCPWCNHGMTTACCAGYAAVVVLREKLH